MTGRRKKSPAGVVRRVTGFRDLCLWSSRIRPGLTAPRARGGGLLGRGRALSGRPGRGRGAAQFAALVAGGVRLLLAPAGAGLLAAARLLVDRRPGPALRLPLGDAPALVALLDVLGLALLLVRVLGLVAPWHDGPS